MQCQNIVNELFVSCAVCRNDLLWPTEVDGVGTRMAREPRDVDFRLLSGVEVHIEQEPAHAFRCKSFFQFLHGDV